MSRLVPAQVCVIMGAFNAQDYVAAALASAREQTMKDWSLVVVDAGSTDATAEVVSRCAAEDQRIRLVRSPVRLSAPQARNAALATVSTELVATLDADDIMLSDRLARQMDLMRRQPRAVAVGGLLRNVDADGLPFQWTSGEPGSPPLTPVTIAYAMPFVCPFLASAGMYRTAALRHIGGFDEDSPWADDYTTIWRLSRQGPLHQVPGVVGEYRRHPASVTARRRHSQGLEVGLLRRAIAADILGESPSIASVLAWTRTYDSPRQATLERAQEELARMNAAFLAHHDVGPSDRAWIDEFHTSLMSRLSQQTPPCGHQ